MILIGGSGHAKVIRDCIKANNDEVNFIFDDNPDLKNLDQTPIIGSYVPDLHPHEEVIIAIGDNRVRKRISNKVKHQFGQIVHPSAILSSSATIGVGTVVMPMCVINASVIIGSHAIINTSSVVEHDCLIESFVHISPNVTLCGNVLVGEGTHLGAGSVVIPNIKIGKWCVIGAGTVIVNDVPDFSFVVGVPGKVIKAVNELE